MWSQRSKRNRRRSFKVKSLPQQFQNINVNAAGIDIGAEQHLVAVPAGRDEVAVRGFALSLPTWWRWLTGWANAG